jgi:hypothetical protein
MALTSPMHAIPGELLTTTERPDDVSFNGLWGVPSVYGSIKLRYGDLFLVIGCWEEDYKLLDETTFGRRHRALALHLRTSCFAHFDDIENIGWLWRPDPVYVELRRESHATR